MPSPDKNVAPTPVVPSASLKDVLVHVRGMCHARGSGNGFLGIIELSLENRFLRD